MLSAAADAPAVESVRVKYLGRKGELAEQFRRMGEMSAEQRRDAGAALNELKQYCEKNLKEAALRAAGSARQTPQRFDVTMPGRIPHLGIAHPLVTTLNDICEIFHAAGFDIAVGPEVETEWYNFEALNVSADHPARDMHDTFYVEGSRLNAVDGKSTAPKYLMRTHTSPVQIHAMQRMRPPVRVIAPGRTYRRDDDVSHTPMFHQVEGLWVDDGVTLRDLKGLLEYFAKSIFGASTRIRVRPSFFPFTEPSIEVDVSCVLCGAKAGGCRVCKHSGWIEILGAGMVHPNVFKSVDYDPSKVTGLAFGMGVERVAMLRYGIDDIHLFYDNDLRFLENLGSCR